MSGKVVRGQRHPRSEHAQSSVNRFKYKGNELQTTGGLGYLDYVW